MKILKQTLVTSTFLAGGILSGNLLAESEWGLGLGANIQNQVYKDLGTEVNALPVIYYESENFYLIGPSFGYEFLELGGAEFTLVGNYRFDGFEAEDELIFEGMEERSGALDVGLEVEYETDYGDFSFSYMADVTGNHEGSEISAGYSLPFILSSGVVAPFVKVSQLNDDLVDYYYGVRADEVTATRAFYEGESTTNFEVGVNSQWQFGDHHKVVANLSLTSMGSEIKDSPLVDGSSSASLIVGYVYVF